MIVALAQVDPTVGDIAANTAKIEARIDAARQAGARLVVFPELAVFGYPPRDLVLRPQMVHKNAQALESIAHASREITTVVGFVHPDPNKAGKGLCNAAAVCRDGLVVATYAKMLLPTYDVFDESRYFNCGADVLVLPVDESPNAPRLGITVCEDLWNNEQFEGRRVYNVDPIERTVRAGAEVLINLSASPFRVDVQRGRETLFARQMREYGLPLIYVNQVGGNDDLIFDGASLVLNRAGEVIARAKAFDEDFLVVDLSSAHPARVEPYPQPIESIRCGLVLGIRDYLRKCGFDEVIVGLSGGIDSAVTACLALEAIGPDRVHAVALPSRYTAEHSTQDARQLAENLGMAFTVIEIEPIHQALERTLAPVFEGTRPDVTEENIQSRIRGTLLMALSNKFGRLLLTTGNKSEWAVGYCTLYGDMCGGLAVLGDVPKTAVYQLARHINETAARTVIPRRIIDRPPSAELRENQTDQDTVPPYDLLDAILERYVEHDLAVDDIVREGFRRDVVQDVVRRVDHSEYKRKQAPIGLKVTSRAFGFGRRVPIAASFR